VTEWKEFRLPTWGVVKKSMRGNLVLDGRNIYEKTDLQEMGLVYEGIGI
jgi:UDPglucose 6-dehydrogenase